MAERCLNYTPNLPLRGGGGGGAGLHQAQNARYPPVAGHDDPADHPAASVVVGPHVGPPQWFADPLAVRVLAAALGTAHALVVQHVHAARLAARLALQAPLRRDGESFGQSAEYHRGDARLELREERFSRQLKQNS